MIVVDVNYIMWIHICFGERSCGLILLELLNCWLNKHVEIIMSMDFIVNHVVQYLCMYGLFHMQGMII